LYEALRVDKIDKFVFTARHLNHGELMGAVGVKGYDTQAATCRAHAQVARRAGHLAARDGTTVSVNQNGECDDGTRRMVAHFGRSCVSLSGFSTR